MMTATPSSIDLRALLEEQLLQSSVRQSGVRAAVSSPSERG